MKFSSPLVKGTLIRRYKRFLADVTLDNGDVITAHCPNTGSMKTCGNPGDTVVLSYNPSPKRKLSYSWELTQIPEGYIGINTMRPNAIVEEAIQQGNIQELQGYDSIRREVKYGQGSKIDILLADSSHTKPDCYVEIKNVTLKTDHFVAFPDAVTLRGLKHTEELIGIVKQGMRAVLLFFVNRPDGTHVEIAKDIDPNYYAGIGRAIAAGVEIICVQGKADLKELKVSGTLPFHFH